MCGRYSVLTEDEIIEVRSIIQEISMRLVKDDMGEYTPPQGEVRPTDRAPVVTKTDGGITFESARFGFTKWDGKGVIINARSETLKDKGMFANRLEAGRCVVPAGEYYEWKERGDAREKKPKRIKHFIKDSAGNLLFFAGLYRDGNEGREFVIITKSAAGAVCGIHDRMPCVLRVNQLEAWLSGALSPDELVNLEYSMDVSPCPRADDNDAESGQLSLF